MAESPLCYLTTTKIGPQLWKLIAPFYINIDGVCYTVPAGFYTDGASVPRILWRVAPPMTGRHAEGAIFHDWLYSKDCPLKLTQVQADALFLKAMKLYGTDLFTRQVLYQGVSLAGSHSFRVKYSESKVKGNIY